MFNHWVTLEDDTFGEWVAEAHFESIRSAFAFQHDWLAICDKHQLGHYAEIGKATSSEKQSYHKVSSSLARRKRQKRVPFLNVQYLNSLRQHRFAGWYRVHHYDANGEHTTSVVLDAGRILRDINPVVERAALNYAEMSPPIHISASTLPMNIFPQSTHIYIRMHSDIYFPKVAKIFECTRTLYPDVPHADNSTLAQLNGCAFNAWLRDLNKLCHSFAGGIRLTEQYNLALSNRPYLTDSGILLPQS